MAFEEYALGVNAAIAAAGRWKRPIELQLLGVRPDPWTPIDSLAIGKLFAWRLGENHSAELLRYALAQELGPRAAELWPPPRWAPQILLVAVRGRKSNVQGPGRRESPESRVATADFSTLDFGLWTSTWTSTGLEWLFPDHHAASNSWVLSGARTASGRPLLANDPHLVIEMPSVWWEVHISAGALNVSGVTIPGIPFVIIGHNSRIAWGLTNVGADVQDFYVERLDSSRQKYRSGDAWLPLETTHYDIRVKGRRIQCPSTCGRLTMVPS